MGLAGVVPALALERSSEQSICADAYQDDGQEMKKIFVGGSRSVTRLNKAATQIIDRIVEEGLTVLIGDANEADRAVQEYLITKEYENVVVFCTRNICRNNLGRWQNSSIDTLAKNNTFQFYAVKDMAMAKEADRGLMIWDSQSKGTLSNIINLLREGKPVDVYSTRTKAQYRLSQPGDLANLLKECDPACRDRFEKELRISDVLLQPSLWG